MSKVRLAIIGCGGNSSGHARRMNQMDEVQIIATCDVNTDIAVNIPASLTLKWSFSYV